MKNKKDLPDEDSDLYKRMKNHLYSKEKLLGEDSPFSELLQNMVTKMLAEETQDIWEQLTPNQQGEIDRALQEVKNGQTVSFETFIEKNK
ncbi:MAG: hypothetical protein P1U56_17500 [Saprospiraceae bacterium]|nr:hypothetical protein [Saprospiraceae bacterium]